MQSKATPAEVTILAAGIALIVGSFAPFYSYGGVSVNAWDPGLSPITLYPVFAGVISAGVVGLRRFANAQLAVRLGTFTWEQVHLLLGLFALVVSAGYFFTDKGGYNFGLGFWITFAGAVALFVGGVMLGRERSGPRGLV